MKRTAFVLGILAFAALAMATDQQAGTVSTFNQPISGRNQSRQSTALYLSDSGFPSVDFAAGSTVISTGADGGAVPTVNALVALTEVEFCASATFDALALYDGGLATYSAYTMPAGLRAFEECNTSTAVTTSTTCGVATPVVGKMGKMLPYRSGASGPPNCQAVDITVAGCPKLYILASAAQTSGSDGGTGCTRLRVGQ